MIKFLQDLFKTKPELCSSLTFGVPGAGKSRLLLADAMEKWVDFGVAIADPHSDLVNHALRAAHHCGLEDRVVFIDPTSLEYATGINLLQVPEGRDHYGYVSELIKCFKKIWGERERDSWGNRMESILLHSLLTLTDPGNTELGMTLLEITPLLTDASFRSELVDRVTDANVQSFWLDRFNKWGTKEQILYAESTLNKLSQLPPQLQLMVGQSRSTINFREIMDDGKILLIDLSKPTLKDSAFLLGALLLAHTVENALSRAAVPESDRRPFFWLQDEAHNVITSSIPELCAEGRKFGLYADLCTQTFAQIPEDLRHQLLGTTRKHVAMAIDRADAEILAPRFWKATGEQIKLYDGEDVVYRSIQEEHEQFINRLTSLKPREAYVHRKGKGARRIRTKHVPDFSMSDRDFNDLKRRVISKHARSRNEVEKEILARRRETVAEETIVVT